MHRTLRALVACATIAAASPGFAHGIWGHVHVTGWAIENLPPGELRDFFSDPEVFNAALFGAAFTDSGYWPQSGDLSVRSRAYSEHTHWEPFVTDFIAWIRDNDPPPWDDLESRKRVAFLMGAASHGLQDEIFDSLFLLQVGEEDGGGQEEADPATDGFLALDAHLRFVPEPYVPYDTLIELYEGLDAGVDRDTIEASVETMIFFYVREGGWLTAEGLGNQYSDEIPWTRAHYLDPAIPGSLRAEINPTAAHLEALWHRLHGRFDANEVLVATYPEVPRRLLSHEADTADSIVTLIFGAGVTRDSVTTLWREDGEGSGDVPHATLGTRWGATYPRLVRLDPRATLRPGGWYVAGLAAGASLIDGSVVESDLTFRFQVECTEGSGDCPPIDVEPPSIDSPLFEDGEPSEDAGSDAADVADAGDATFGDDADAGPGPDVAPDTDPETDAFGDVDASPDGEADPEDAATVSGDKRGCASARGPTPNGVLLLVLVLLQASMRMGWRRAPQDPANASNRPSSGRPHEPQRPSASRR